MLLIESIERINTFLKRDYGRSFDDRPNYRVVFSEDQIEKRWTDKTKDGFQLLQPEVRELPKYRQYIKEKYVLERLTVIPEFVETDLTERISYEPVWVFEDSKGNYLPPRYDACRFIIDSINQNMAHRGGPRKYKDDPELEKKELEKLIEKLFGNETSVGDSLAYKEAIVVPRNYEGGKE